MGTCLAEIQAGMSLRLSLHNRRMRCDGSIE